MTRLSQRAAGISQSVGDARYKTLEAVIVPTLMNSWVSFDSVGYYRTPQGEGVVQGWVSGGTKGTAAFNLPAGYRPAFEYRYPTVANNNAFSVTQIMVTGDVIPLEAAAGYGTWWSFGSLRFRIAA